MLKGQKVIKENKVGKKEATFSRGNPKLPLTQGPTVETNTVSTNLHQTWHDPRLSNTLELMSQFVKSNRFVIPWHTTTNQMISLITAQPILS